MRIVSLVPNGTEILFAVGAGGVSAVERAAVSWPRRTGRRELVVVERAP